MLTKEKLKNIHKLSLFEVKQIYYECEEVLGLSDLETSSKALGVSKRRIYQLMNKSNSITIGKHKFPCINLIIDKQKL